MADTFKGSSKIILLEGDAAVDYDFEFTKCTSRTSNDGFLPYNLDATSVTVVAYSEDGTAVTLVMIESTSLANNICTVSLNYPGEPGKYILEFEVELENGSTVLHAAFSRIFCEELLS